MGRDQGPEAEHRGDVRVRRRSEMTLRGDYLDHRDLVGHFSDRRLHVAFYDHLVADPAGFLERAFGLLGSRLARRR